MQEAWSIPFGQLQDLIAIDLIKRGEYEQVLTQEEEVADLLFISTWK